MDLSAYALDTLHQDGEFVLSRGRAKPGTNPAPTSILVSAPISEHPAPKLLRMLEHELALRGELDSSWAARPLALAQYRGRTALVRDDPQGEPLEHLLDRLRANDTVGASRPGGPRIEPGIEPGIGLGLFLTLGVGIAAALGEAHRRGIIHKDNRATGMLMGAASARVWLTCLGGR